MATFTWKVEAKPVQSKNPRVTNIKFGDGYEQRASVGINTNPQVWSVSFNGRDEAEASEIDQFLEARGGVESFDWTAPGQLNSKKFKCQEWQLSPDNGNIWSVSAKFEEVFDL